MYTLIYFLLVVNTPVQTSVTNYMYFFLILGPRNSLRHQVQYVTNK